MKKISILSLAVLSTLLGLTFAGCGKSGTGVSLTSAPFSTTTADLSPWNPRRLMSFFIPEAYAGGITSLSFCVTEFKLEAADGSDIKNSDAAKEGESDDSLFSAKLGLINLGSGGAPVNWGTLSIPSGTVVKSIHIELHKDPQLCQGAQYSVSVNGQDLTKDLEFKFTFTSPKALSAGDGVQVSMNKLAAVFTAAAGANALTDTLIGQFFDPTDPTKSAEDSAE